MGRKNKPKKTSAKKERYMKFRKEKPSVLTINPPDFTEEQMKERRVDELNKLTELEIQRLIKGVGFYRKFCCFSRVYLRYFSRNKNFFTCPDTISFLFRGGRYRNDRD